MRGVDICLRCMAEYKTAQALGGFGFFDTLTYDRNHLPKFHGVSCFNKADIGSFMKRLRSCIDRYFEGKFKVDNKDAFPHFSKYVLSYCVVSEFGEDYGRVHYHVLFFVKTPLLDVYTLKRFIRQSWYYGIVDPNCLIQKHIINSNAVLHYMTKYINKYQEWTEIYNNAIKTHCSNKLDIEKGLKKVRPFYRCSNNLGLSFIKENVNIDNGLVHIQDNECSRDFQISRYYVYKLYYDIVKENGKYRYQINDLGISRKLAQLHSVIKATELRYRNVCLNLPSQDNERIYQYMENRTLYDLAVYKCIYKDCRQGIGTDEIEPIEFFIKSRFPSLTQDNPLIEENAESENHLKNSRQNFLLNRIQEDRYIFRNFDKVLQIIERHVNSNKEKINAGRTHSDNLYKSLKNVL